MDRLMISKDWERKSLQYLKMGFFIDDAGPLYSPVESFEFSRMDDLSLELTTTSHMSSSRDMLRFPELKAGSVTALDTQVVFASKFSRQPAIAYGVHTLAVHEHADTPTRNRIRKERCSVQKIEQLPEAIDKVIKLAEWIDNFDLSFFCWPDKVEINWSQDTKVYGNDKKLLFSTSEHSNALQRGLELKVGDINIYIVPGKKMSHGGPNGQATILYDGYPNSDFRDRLRNCISLTIGVPIVSLGHILLGEDSEHLGFQLLSPYIIDHSIYKIYALPPAPLASGNSKLIAGEIISHIVNSYFDNYEKLNLRHVCWLYWHAACSATHARAVQLGAAIESLITAYRSLNPDAYPTGIVDKPLAKKISKALKESLVGIEMDPKQKSDIELKISNINQASLRVINDRFFEHLGLVLGDKERAAWQRRNDSAHGKASEKNDAVSLIRDISLLENLFHRILLKLTGASPVYIDRYTEEHPIRALTQSVDTIARMKF
jgi:hypothetical protein